MQKKFVSILILIMVVSLLAAGCGKKSATNNFLGNWVDIKNSTRYAKIYVDKNDKYIWEDNENKYNAHLDKDTLIISVPEYKTEAKATYDKTSEHLKVTLLTEKYEFKRESK